jgi:hypothetical protein
MRIQYLCWKHQLLSFGTKRQLRSNLYAVPFSMLLQNDRKASWDACRLLVCLTRKHHVTNYRIKQLRYTYITRLEQERKQQTKKRGSANNAKSVNNKGSTTTISTTKALVGPHAGRDRGEDNVGLSQQQHSLLDPLLVLLHVYACYDQAGAVHREYDYTIPTNVCDHDRLLDAACQYHTLTQLFDDDGLLFGDWQEWEQHVLQSRPTRHSVRIEGHMDRDKSSVAENNKECATTKSWPNEDTVSCPSRAKDFSSRGIIDFNPWPVQYLAKDNTAFSPNNISSENTTNVLLASDLLHIILMQSNGEDNDGDTRGFSTRNCWSMDVLARLHFYLPYLLYQEWHCASTDATINKNETTALKERMDSNTLLIKDIARARERLIRVIASFACSAYLPQFPEIERFIVCHILPCYQGPSSGGLSDDETHDCWDLVFQNICPKLTTLPQLLCTWSNSQVKRCLYRPLERAFMLNHHNHEDGGGSSSSRNGTKHHIISIAATGILQSLRYPVRPSFKDNNIGNNNNKQNVVEKKRMNTLMTFVQWIDRLIVVGLYGVSTATKKVENFKRHPNEDAAHPFYNTKERHGGDGDDDDGGVEMLCRAAIDFFQLVCQISQESKCVIAAPSPQLMFRLVTSDAAVCVDRSCRLLVQYKKLLRNLQQESKAAKEKELHQDTLFEENKEHIMRLAMIER